MNLQMLPLIAFALVLGAAAAPAQSTHRISIRADGMQPDRDIDRYPAISWDRSVVAFSSWATNLVLGDVNEWADVFVHDRRTGLLQMISLTPTGGLANHYSGAVSCSADGRFIAFGSQASNLVTGDFNDQWDVFLHDRATGLTELVSVSTSGQQGDDDSSWPAISADGSCIAFTSLASNFGPGGTSSIPYNAFVHDRRTGITEQVSVAWDGGPSNDQCLPFPSISADGRFVAFMSTASNLVPGDRNGEVDVFVRDRMLGVTERASVRSDGAEGSNSSYDPSISADGRFVAFWSQASDLVQGDVNHASDVFIHDRWLRRTALVSRNSAGDQGDRGSTDVSLSADGRFVCFDSIAANLVAGDTNLEEDVFVRDLLLGVTERVSLGNGGTQGNDWSQDGVLSADGSVVAFLSQASDLVPGDTNGNVDLFIRARGPGSGATAGTIVLAADVHLAEGRSADFSWFAAPPDAHWWLLTSAKDLGSTIAGHPFGVGPGFRIMATGHCDARGTGSFTTAPFPAWTAGRTVYVEIGARDAAGRVWDSNLLERIVQ